ncbi:MAG: hypothetical protein U9O82_00080 [Thermodesulfobacteriota bacterium]|nr:hypothetical protein [Thermodesulfobacteriota bacterium]
MTIQKLYKRIIFPLNILSLGAIVIFLGLGVANILGAGETPEQAAGYQDGGTVIKVVPPIEKKVGLAGEITINKELNPFTPDHTDWQPTQIVETAETVELNLEVLGISFIRNKKKALIKDLDTRESNFWLSHGDQYKGYEVVYISKQNIIFSGKKMNIRFALKRGKGKPYSGKGSILVAPDIDLYLKDLAAEEKGGLIAAEAMPNTAEGNAEIVDAATVESKQHSRRTSASRTSTVGALTAASSKGGAESSAPAAGDSTTGSTREEEMAFIEMLKEIFQK